MIPFISAAIAAIAPVLAVVEKVCTTILTVTAAASAVIDLGQRLGILDPDCSCEDLGTQVLCAEQDGIRPEDFRNPDDYIARVRAIDVNRYDVDRWDERTKMLKSIEFTSRAIADKIGVSAAGPLEGLVRDVGREDPFYTVDRVTAYLEASREGALDLADVSDYLNGRVWEANRASEIRTRMIQAELARDPGADRAEIERRIDAYTPEA